MSQDTGHDASWHEKRREGIGGSDIAAIFGLSSWKSPVDIYRLKVGLDEPRDAGEAAARGSRLEGDVVRRFSEASGMTVTEGFDFMRHPDWPRTRIQANTDGTLPGEPPGIFEAKTASRGSSTAGAFLDRIVPIWYATQVQGYLSVTGYDWGVIAALLGPSATNMWDPDQCDLVALRFERNDLAIQMIEEVVQEFWACVDAGNPPRWRMHNLTSDLVQSLRHTPTERIC